MFRELKEYQDIQKIYEESVYHTLEEKVIIDALTEQDFTLEELEYIIENINEVLNDTFITEGVEQQQLDEFAKALVKAATPLAKRMAQGFSKNVNKIPVKNQLGGIQKSIQKGNNLLKTGTDKIKPFMSGAKEKFKTAVNKIKPILNNKTAVGGGGALASLPVIGQLSKALSNRKNNKVTTDASGKVIPSTAQIRADAKAKRGGIDAVGGGNAGASTDSGGTSKNTIKSVPVKKEVSTMTKQGKPRTKAQMMAAKRIADGKSIQDVKDANTASMKAKAAERNKKFQDAKKSGNLAQFRKDNPKLSGADRAKQMAKERLAKKAAMEEFTPYDIVLEYLLSSKQAATIEEANYIMTEMDAKTIQSIVSE
tara:strand:+ start:2010 stop:3110 length:1101 start_codon:yes stop_codon:yes gene_type:complete